MDSIWPLKQAVFQHDMGVWGKHRSTVLNWITWVNYTACNAVGTMLWYHGCYYLVVDLLQRALCSLRCRTDGPSITLHKSSWWVHVIPVLHTHKKRYMCLSKASKYPLNFKIINNYLDIQLRSFFINSPKQKRYTERSTLFKTKQRHK